MPVFNTAGLRRSVYLMVLISLGWACPSLGAGFAILQQGTGAMGQGNAFVAQADDPSAVFFNPAGITDLEGSQTYAGGTFIIPRITYKGNDGSREATVTKVYFPPHLYFTRQVTEDFAMGIGIFSPFGLSTVWHGNWEGRYLTTYSRLTTVNFNPNLAYRWRRLSVAAGFNAMSGELVLKKRLPLYYINPILADGTQELSDTTWGYGYNLGLLYKFDRQWSLGLSYRSKIKLDFDSAEAKFDVPAAMAPFFQKTGAEGELELPPSLTCGISYRPNDRWAMEFDLTWTGWSTYEEVRIEFDDPVGPTGTTEFVQPKKWRDVLAYRFGIKYMPSPEYTFRFGYIFDQSPVPRSTLDPQLPDGNRDIYALGLDYRLNSQMVLGFAYNFIYGHKREKDNDILETLLEADRANGEYKQRIHSFALSFLYRF